MRLLLRRDRSTRWLEDARYADMQTVSVLGGGVYEHDRFDNLLDRFDTLVWQDLYASPVIETLRRIVPEGERCHHRPAMGWHKKDEPKTIGDMLVESVTSVPENLGGSIDRTQMNQVLGLKFGIEHFRRRELRCSGALVWQTRGCWQAQNRAVAT